MKFRIIQVLASLIDNGSKNAAVQQLLVAQKRKSLRCWRSFPNLRPLSPICSSRYHITS